MTPAFFSPRFDPRNCFWAASDGRIYSSARNALVYSYDPAYLAFVAKNGSALPWPVDIQGKQTTAALQELMSQYGITVAV